MLKWITNCVACEVYICVTCCLLPTFNFVTIFHICAKSEATFLNLSPLLVGKVASVPPLALSVLLHSHFMSWDVTCKCPVYSVILYNLFSYLHNLFTKLQTSEIIFCRLCIPSSLLEVLSFGFSIVFTVRSWNPEMTRCQSLSETCHRWIPDRLCSLFFSKTVGSSHLAPSYLSALWRKVQHHLENRLIFKSDETENCGVIVKIQSKLPDIHCTQQKVRCKITRNLL